MNEISYTKRVMDDRDNLLEALRALLLALRREQEANGLREEMVTTSSAVTKARSAIRKATGTNP